MRDVYLATVKQRLIEARAEHGFSQRELARRSGVSVEAVRCFENGTRNPTLGTLHDLALALEMDPAALLALGPPSGPDATVRLRQILDGQPQPVIDAVTACARAIVRNLSSS